jgi:hypothetical protein
MDGGRQVGDNKEGWSGGWHSNPVQREFRALAAYKARMVQVRINLTDEAGECDHGALPLDRTKPPGCTCWTAARTDALANRVQDSPDYCQG